MKKMKSCTSKQGQAKQFYIIYSGESCSKTIVDLDCDLAALSPRQQ